MQTLTIPAPAKINLHLRIKDKRPDGFHNLESIFLSLDFGDTLRFETVEKPNVLEISMTGLAPDAPNLSGENNIIFKAITQYRRHTGFSQGLRVAVEKRIPLGGGLGGGSSNAASALLALNALAAAAGERPLPDTGLVELAACLGSDVPFFLCKTGAAWVSGRGEIVTPLAAPKNIWLVLVNPGFSSNTAAAYRILDETRADGGTKAAGTNSPGLEDEAALIRALQDSPASWPFQNDFLAVFGHITAYTHILAQLRQAGAAFSGLSGSGAACYGAFDRCEKAEKAADFLMKEGIFTKITFPLAHEAKPVIK